MTYHSKPERKGYRLTEEGEQLYQNWLDLGGCICFTGCAPCSSCHNEGHPISLGENDEVWEPESKPTTPVFAEGSPLKTIYEEWLGKNKDKSFAQQISETEGGNDVSRSDVVNVKECTVPSGHTWTDPLNSYDKYIKSGWTNEQLIYSNILQPETKKEFKEGYWYKLSSKVMYLELDTWYKILYTKGDCIVVRLKDGGESHLINQDRFDVNSESSVSPIIELSLPRVEGAVLDALSSVLGVNMGENTVSKVSLDENRKLTVQLTGSVKEVMVDLQNANSTCVGMVRQTNDLTKQTEEKQTMSNKTNRRVLNIQLLDNDAGLPVEHSLVAEFNGVVTEDSNEITVQEIISTGEVAERIKVHNEVRAKQLDLGILKSTGQKVNLLPIKLKDLTWNIK